MRDDPSATKPSTRRVLRWPSQLIAGWRRRRLQCIHLVGRASSARPSYGRPTGSTRHLCAAVQLHPEFRAHVLKSIVHERHRAIAPSYGVDVPQVVKHCLVADRRDLIRDACLTALLVALVPALLLGILHAGVTPALLVLGATYPVIWIHAWCVRHVIETRLRRGGFRPYDVTFDAERNDVLWRVADRENANVIVYGRYHPFVGSGDDVDGGWSFSVDIRRGRRKDPTGSERLTPVPFRCRELYDHVAGAVRRLGLDGVTVEDRLYVHGPSVRDFPDLLPDQFAQPNPRVEPSVLERFVEHPRPSARHYQCIQVVTWAGDVVVSYLLRFEKAGTHLYVESTPLLLMPILSPYRAIDRLPDLPVGRWVLHLLLEAAVPALVELGRAPFRLMIRVWRARSRVREERKERDLIRLRRDHDYGAENSLRERTGENDHTHYFQLPDVRKCFSIVQTKVFESIVEFLDERQIDTEDLRKRDPTILNTFLNNQGVVMTGGHLMARDMATGTGASIAGQTPRSSPAAKPAT